MDAVCNLPSGIHVTSESSMAILLSLPDFIPRESGYKSLSSYNYEI